MPECEKCKKEGELNEGLCADCLEDDDNGSLSQSGTPTPCPCGEGPTNNKALLMQCSDCKKWWHPACVGLLGLTQYFTKKLVEYKCPLCFSLPKEIMEKLGIPDKPDDTNESQTISATVKKEVTAMLPAVVEEVVAGVKAALGGNTVQQMVKEANETINKSWADIAKTEQKRVMSEVVGKTADSALQKSLSRISADLSEQKTRLRNCIMSNVPEGYGGTDTSLSEVVVSFADEEISADDIAYCNRLGKKEEGKNRLILIVCKREDMAAEFHNFGRGRKLPNNVWINQDMTKTEREAKYHMRQERRVRIEESKRNKRQPVRNAGEQPEETRNAGEQPEETRNEDNDRVGEETAERTRRVSTRGTAQSNSS